MKSALKPTIQNLDAALSRLEAAVDQQMKALKKKQPEPQRDNSKKIATRLDQTINRLEMLLSEEA